MRMAISMDGRLMIFCAAVMISTASSAATVRQLRDGWRLQSGCTTHAEGSAISQVGFADEGWLKTTVPSTVVAAQAAAKTVPDPYFGMNLRDLPGMNYPIGHNFANLP